MYARNEAQQEQPKPQCYENLVIYHIYWKDTKTIKSENIQYHKVSLRMI